MCVLQHVTTQALKGARMAEELAREAARKAEGSKFMKDAKEKVGTAAGGVEAELSKQSW